MMKKFALVLSCALAALAIPADAATNSLVRFRFTYGGNPFGDVDVVLFDDDRPITVSNFLAYVQSRRYDNSFLNQLVPGIVLQGGEYTVPNPYSSAAFEIATRVTTYPDITNEFQLSPARSNVFGTLGMAKVDGAPNSANSAWYFNLQDNSADFDNHNGGYTVFGQVTNGANVLRLFTTLYLNHGVLDMSDPIQRALGCAPLYRYPTGDLIAFPLLPVAFYGQGCIRYSDLFQVQVSMISGPDVLGPKLTITSPKAGSTLTNDSINVTGTALDPGGVASVRVYLNTNAPQTALGSNSWSITLNDVPPGTNTLFVEASDPSGNRSRASVSFFRSVKVPLVLAKVGAGTITGPANGELLELTRNYKLTAKAAPGNLFVAWTGAFTEVSTTLAFTMDTNLAFTAVFATNLFPMVKGTYTGLFYDTNEVDQMSSGFITLTLGDLGAYSAKLLMNGRTYKFTGLFSADGSETNLLLLNQDQGLRFLMNVDLVGGTDQIRGVVTNRDFGFLSSPSWVADLTLDRAVFNAKLNPATLFAGPYTLIIPADTNSPPGPGPAGDGYAAVKVDTKGGVSVSGLLADNTKLSWKGPLSKQGVLPFYVPLYKGAGCLVSWVTFTNQTDSDCLGRLNWFKKTDARMRYYGRGFTNDVTLVGSRYVPPTTNRVLNLTSTVIGFTNGNLLASFANDVVLGADNKFVNGSPNQLSLTLVKPTGLLKGSVTPPNTNGALPLRGAVLQKQNRGAGLLLGTDKTSRVALGP
jgi:cyclophilin family peptidyl-prolyl cis-trans isomerase